MMMMTKNSNLLVILNCVCSGQNGDGMGSDEMEIVFLTYLLIDLNSSKTIDVLNYAIRPKKFVDKFGYFLSDECKQLTNLSENKFENAVDLETALENFEKYLLKRNLHPAAAAAASLSDDDHLGLCSGCDLTFLTDGQLHLRQLLVPECAKKNIQLASFYYKFYDLRKEFLKQQRNLSVRRPVDCSVDQLLQELSIEPEQNELNYSIRCAKNMEKIVYKLLENGHMFKLAERINDDFKQQHQQSSFSSSLSCQIEEKHLVKVRGLPWQCTDKDLFKYFAGLNITDGGIAMCLSAQGRRNGEALVHFECEEHRDLALRRHKHHLGSRYIEIYKGSLKEFLNATNAAGMK